jgi:hypothetical protein
MLFLAGIYSYTIVYVFEVVLGEAIGKQEINLQVVIESIEISRVR